MTKIHSYQDGNYTSYANIRMDNGDPVYISVSPAGVIIKKSIVGLFGAKLFVSRDDYHAVKVAEILDEKIDDKIIPENYSFNNLVLKSFVKACLSCNTIAEFTILINEAV